MRQAVYLAAITLSSIANSTETWDWKSPELFQAYYSPDRSKAIELHLNSPFFMPGNPLFSVAPAQMDMWEADGWTLVQKDFGSPDMAPRYPNFVLYNKYRGILRVALYLPEHLERANGYIGQIQILKNPSSGNSTPLFTFSAYPNCFVNDYDPNATERCLNQSIMNANWLTCDFVMSGYDPNLLEKDLYLDFRIFVIDVSQILLNSSGTINLQLEQQSPVTVAGSPAGFTNALNSLQTGYSIYKNDTEAIEAIKQGDHGGNTSWVAAIVSGAAEAAGLGPIMSSLAGALTSYLGGGPGQATPMNFKGTLKFSTTGQLTNSHALWDFPIKLGRSNDVSYGIFNLEDKPIILDNIAKEGSKYRHTIAYLRKPQIKLNQNIGYSKSNISVAYTFENAKPGIKSEINGKPEFFQLTENKCSFISDHSKFPTGLALKLTATPPGPTILAGSQIEILKVYPAEVRSRLSATLECRKIPLTNRQMDQGVVGHYRIQAKIEDPLLAGGYFFTWGTNENHLRPEKGCQQVAGGGPSDNFIELLVTRHGNYRIEFSVRDTEGNSGSANINLNIRLHDR